MTDTPTSAPTPSATAIPEELLAEIRPAFGAVLFIQAIAEVLDQTAILRSSGKLGGIETFDVLLAVGALIDQLEEVRVGADYMDIIEPSVNDAYAVLQDIKGIIARWFNDEITSGTVMEEMLPVLYKTADIANGVDDILAEELALDREEMTKYRDEMKMEIHSVFEELIDD